MKKSYVKPELFYESFVLAQHIAGCNLTIINSTDVMLCSASGTVNEGFGSVYGENWFTTANTSCAEDQKLDVYCYTNGSITSANINS